MNGDSFVHVVKMLVHSYLTAFTFMPAQIIKHSVLPNRDEAKFRAAIRTTSRVGMRLLCSKICLLCYSTLLKNIPLYAFIMFYCAHVSSLVGVGAFRPFSTSSIEPELLELLLFGPSSEAELLIPVAVSKSETEASPSAIFKDFATTWLTNGLLPRHTVVIEVSDSPWVIPQSLITIYVVITLAKNRLPILCPKLCQHN